MSPLISAQRESRLFIDG